MLCMNACMLFTEYVPNFERPEELIGFLQTGVIDYWELFVAGTNPGTVQEP